MGPQPAVLVKHGGGWTSHVDTPLPPGCLLTKRKTTYCVPGNQLDIFIGSLALSLSLTLSCSRRVREVSPELGVKMGFLDNLMSSDSPLCFTNVHSQQTMEGAPRLCLSCQCSDVCAKALLFRGWNSGGMELETNQLGSWTWVWA